MPNTVAYPDITLEKFIGIDSTEDPTAFIRLLKKKICFSLGSRPAVNGNNIQTVYDDRRKAFSLPSYAAQLLNASIHLKLHYHRTK